MKTTQPQALSIIVMDAGFHSGEVKLHKHPRRNFLFQEFQPGLLKLWQFELEYKTPCIFSGSLLLGSTDSVLPLVTYY